MTEHAVLTRLVEDDAGVAVPPARETISAEPEPPCDQAPGAERAPIVEPPSGPISAVTAAPPSAATTARDTPDRRASGRWLPALCAVVALIAAAVTLAAPTVRPAIVNLADAWLGSDNTVSRVLMPSPEADAGWRMAREQAMQAVNGRLAEYNTRLNQMAAAQQAANADVTRAAAALHADHAASQTLVRTVDALAQETKELRSATMALDGQSRAVGLLTLSLRLRRDVDAGLPVVRDYAALAATGPYPAPVDRALQQLRQLDGGVPTMRDLADEFDLVMASVAARANAEASWAGRGWARVSGLFGGGGVTGGKADLVAHLRALAADGRFSEAAEQLMASNDADLGAEWARRVRARATAVIAAQVLLNHALTAYETAYTAPAGDAAGKPTQ